MAKTTPKLNTTLLFNSDSLTKLKLIQQLNNYTLENLSVKGSCWTRDDFLKLTQLIVDPAFRIRHAENAKRWNYPDDLMFSPMSGVIKHLKGIKKRTGEADSSDDLLRQLLL
jgi:hypothetical protein